MPFPPTEQKICEERVEANKTPKKKKKKDKSLQARLARILTDDYCGVALGFDRTRGEYGEFIIYQWGDAPVSSELLGFGEAIEEAVESYDKWYSKNHTKAGKRRKVTWYHPNQS